MKLLPAIKIATLFLLGVLSAYAVWADTIIPASDPKLQYTGRIDFSNRQAPQLSWPGTSIAANFTGPSLTVVLDDQFGNNYFNVFIDDDYEHPLIIRAGQGERKYPVATNLPNGPHKFLLTKRTEGEEGATAFKGLELARSGTLLAPPVRLARRIEFFGDSITSGAGNEAPDNGPDNFAKDKNNFMTYDAITARNLNAELHVTSQSGIGLMISWFPFTMPQFYNQLSAVGKNDSRWDFSRWTPDVVVINLFQNDAWLIDREHRLRPEPDDEQRVQAYMDFVKTVRATYPSAYIVCALGSMDAMRPGSKWPGYVSSAVARLKQANPEERMDTIFFEFTGYAAHPRVAQHIRNADKLSAFLREKMHW
ncbi:SGNH/GDSL hydrolase family protein [Undibacterium sp. CY18W]|uniref:SGNH/GDSL hydrolase family protein n=1 Tax=Undibacterium hunanense TaxID=2762292 RepID=A0ABR6ZNM0_9BURK|nr:SGNH/GDSL hydrolase family protein [Undibacterium hunanense]MBC3917464.1 SGNH/GDSL hydrolase family protein [Undibacterium hunanense]